MKVLLFVTSLAMFWGCVTPFEPEIEKYDKILVIDAMLTNDVDVLPEVKLSYSLSKSEYRSRQIPGAKVTIYSSLGKVYTLEQVAPNSGYYRYYGDEKIGKVGVSYKLSVRVAGEVYETEYELMQPVPAIDSIEFALDEKDNQNGVIVYTWSQGTTEDTKHYVWEIDETWVIGVQYGSLRFGDKQYCYIENQDKGIKIGTSEHLSVNTLDRHPVYRIPFTTSRLRHRYSGLLKQYSISRDTYKYYEHLEAQNVNNGGVFDPIPSHMNGNITCTSNTEIPVLGNFQVSAVTSKRFYIDRSNINVLINIPNGLDGCTLEGIPFGDSALLAHKLFNEFKIIMDTLSNGGVPYQIRLTNRGECFDCTYSGAPNTPPDWWESGIL